MPHSARRPHFKFQAKVLIPVVTVMVLLLAVTMSVVNRRFKEQLQTEPVQKLNAANAVFQYSQQIHATNLFSRYSNIANEPRVKNVSQQGDPNTLRVSLNELIEELKSDLILFTSDKVEPIGVSRDPRLNLPELVSSSAPSIQAAVDGQPKVDTVRVGGRLFDVVSIPVIVSGFVVGVLTFGEEIGETVARRFSQLTGTEVVFLADNHVVASTLAKPSVEELTKQSLGSFLQIQPLLLNGEQFEGLSGRFPSLKGDGSLSYYLLLYSKEPAMRDLRATQKMLMAVSLTAILLGTLTVWWLVRKITQPLRELRDGAEAVGRGDFSRRVAVTSRDECGELAATFNQMTENLKTSREQLETTVDTLKTTQAQLIQSEKVSAIGEFVAGVAHELNNPLTSVMGFAQLLQQSDTTPQHQRFLDRIFSEARRCSKIVQSLLSFARQHAPERKCINLNDSVNAALEILRYQLRTSGIEVVTDLNPKLPEVMADPHQIQQVFVNLINNARQAMEGNRPKGLLRASSELVGERARVVFQDDGPGISEENLKKLFSPFFTTKEAGKGTGLGLSLSLGIIQEHGGTISVKSKLGDGATFIIDLPIAQGMAAAESVTTARRATPDEFEGDGKKVLVVDDEDAILELAREILSAAHFSVDTANDGKSALRKLRQNRYDLTVCDLKMPDLSGQQIYELLRTTNPEAASRLIFMTGDVVSERTQEFFERHGKICLAKPFSLEDFRAVLKKVFDSTKPGA